MNIATFEHIVEERLYDVSSRLSAKGRDYALGADRLENFATMAAIGGTTPARACLGAMLKHFASVVDMVNNGGPFPRAAWDEKIGDAVCYLVLLEACVRDGSEEARAREDDA